MLAQKVTIQSKI